MKRLSLKILLIAALASGFLAGAGLVHTPKASAAAIPGYNQQLLISDGLFTDNSSMSAQDIQNFLAGKNSGLQNYSDVENCSAIKTPYFGTYYPHCGSSVSAATIIYDAAQAYSISPKAILATLQKEQSLITTPSPTQSQLNYAMGYGCPDSGGCSLAGFFNQVDNGTWQFRTDMQLGSGSNWWGYTPSSYPCNSSTRYYSAALKSGNNVTFYDDNGTAYENFTIQNMSTATLYCYTPHAYNNPSGINGVPAFGTTGQYYSGSYNFVASYIQWFGSTNPLTWQLVSYTSSNGYFLAPGEMSQITLTAKNTGDVAWNNTSNPVRLATWYPTNRNSPFCSDATNWVGTCNRAATLQQSTVAPGDNGTFVFTVQAPAAKAAYVERFNLVMEGVAWFQDPWVEIDFNVGDPFKWQVVSSTSSNGFSLAPGQTSTITLNARNTGAATWNNSSNPVRLATWQPTNHNSPFCSDITNWVGTCNRAATLQQTSVPPGSIGTFTFTVQMPSTSGFYPERYNLVAEGLSWFDEAGYELDFTVGNFYTWQLQSYSSTNGFSLSPGQLSQVTMHVVNTGTVTWTNTNNPVRLATWYPTNHNSPFCSSNTNWIGTCNRAANLQESSVPPGGTGTFVFTIQAPAKTGFYVDRYNLVMEGISWFQDPWVEIDLTVH